ncbi:MAG: hypothetical protein AAF771_03050 [Pseudomonadota bacterium]
MEHSVTISDELRRLVGELRGGEPRNPPAEAPQAETLVQPPDAGALVPSWRMLRLWRDGLRPLCFRGVPILEVHVLGCEEGGGVAQSAALYLREAGAAVFAATLLPPPGLPARPSYRANAVDNADTLERCIAACRPSACLLPACGGLQPVAADGPLQLFESQLTRLRAAVLNYVKI